jgi:oxalate decarboxylase
MSELKRRQFLTGAAAFTTAATATLAGAGRAPGDDQPPQPVRGAKGAPIIGPSNPSRQAQSPDRVNPPATDSGTLPTLRWSFSDSHIKMREGGWSRQTTIREIPSSTDLALVNMRLKAGGVRELHWHKPAEWAYMLKGRARITAIDEAGRAFQDDVAEGDLWNFPSGIPHSLQGLEGDGCEFLLVFDDGNFSEDSTFSVTDWLAHTPREVLAKNFGVPERAFAGIPADKELFIFQSKVPGPLTADRVAGAGPLPTSFSHRLLAQEPIRTAGGSVRISDSTTFPAATTIAAGFVEVEPGGMRELHWHPNANEAQYYISGQARMTVFAADATAGTFDYQPGDVGFVPRNMGHYIENTGTTKLQFLELWRTDKFSDVSLRQWLAFTPYELVHANVKIDRSVLAKIPTHKTPVVPG